MSRHRRQQRKRAREAREALAALDPDQRAVARASAETGYLAHPAASLPWDEAAGRVSARRAA